MLRIDDSDLDLDHDLEGSYEGKPFTGVAFELYPGGQLLSEIPYVNGRQEGLARSWYPTGELSSESEYRDNRLHGTSREWFEGGQLECEETFERGILVSKREWDRNGQLKLTYEIDETSPYFRFLGSARSEG